MRTQRCFILLHCHRHGNTAQTFNTSHNKCASFTLTRQNCARPRVLEAFGLFYSQNRYGDRYFNACLCPPRDEEGQDGSCVLPAWDLSGTLADVLPFQSFTSLPVWCPEQRSAPRLPRWGHKHDLLVTRKNPGADRFMYWTVDRDSQSGAQKWNTNFFDALTEDRRKMSDAPAQGSLNRATSACWFQDTWRKGVMRCRVYFLHSLVCLFSLRPSGWPC